MAAGPMHQQERPGLMGCAAPYPRLRDRADVIAFISAPLTEPVEVVGTVVARLWVSSDAVDTDVTVKLLDIAPPSQDWPEGFDLNVCDTILRLRYREGWDREVLMTPG